MPDTETVLPQGTMAGLIEFIGFLLGGTFHIIILATTSLFTLVAGSVLVQIYQADRAYNEFKRRSNGLMMAKDRNIICNHTLCPLYKNPGRAFLEEHQKYGRKTWGWLHHTLFGATTLDAELMKRIVLDQPNKNLNRIKINGPAAEFMEDSLMLAEDDQWRRLRRAVAPALRSNKFKAPNVVRELESSIDKLVEAIEKNLSTSNNDPKLQAATIGADDLLHRFTLDVVFRCFYKQYDLIDYEAPKCRWVELVDEGLKGAISLPVKLGLSIHALRKPIDWLIMNFHQQGVWRGDLINFIKRQTQLSLRARMELEELREKGVQVDEDNFQMKDGSHFRRNMADHITDHLLDGKITQREYFNTSSFLITAGDKTVVDSLVYTLYQLAIDVDGVQEKLRQSIEQEGADSVYLDWVLSESLRLMPPVTAACSRTVVEDMEIEDGKRIPAGTFVSYPSYIVHRLKEYWGHDADAFRPERWLDTSNHHPLQYVPFGAGPRRCPGREFALYEMKESLSRLLLRYRFRCRPKADIDEFHSPYMIYLLFNSPTFIEITRL